MVHLYAGWFTLDAYCTTITLGVGKTESSRWGLIYHLLISSQTYYEYEKECVQEF